MSRCGSPAGLPPPRPIAAAIVVVVSGGSVLLVRRANRPDAGMWGFPGGRIETGETITNAAVRELLEETGIHGEPLCVLTAVDAFDRDDEGLINQHFVLVAVLCRWVSGKPVAADDALDARWFPIKDLDTSELALSVDVARIAQEGAAISVVMTASSNG